MGRRLVSRVSGSSESSSRVRYLAERRARRNSSRVVPPSTSPSPSSSRRVYSPPVPLWRPSPSTRFTSRLRPLVAAQQSTGTHEPADRVHTGNQIVLAPFRVESELWFVWVFSPSDPVLPHHRPRFARIKGESRAGLASIDIFSTMEPGSCLHETVLTETFRQLDKAVFDFEMLAGGTEGDLDAVRDAHTGISDLLVREFVVDAARGY